MPLYLQREVSRLWWIPVGILAGLVFLGLMLAVMSPTYISPPPPLSTCHMRGTTTICYQNLRPAPVTPDPSPAS
jgi:hypothetical protein